MEGIEHTQSLCNGTEIVFSWKREAIQSKKYISCCWTGRVHYEGPKSVLTVGHSTFASPGVANFKPGIFDLSKGFRNPPLVHNDHLVSPSLNAMLFSVDLMEDPEI